MMSGATGADAPGSDGVLQRVKQENEACSPSTNMYSPGATVLNQEVLLLSFKTHLLIV